MTSDDERLLQALLEEQARLRAGMNALDAKLTTFRERIAMRASESTAVNVDLAVAKPGGSPAPSPVPAAAKNSESSVLIPPPLPAAAVSPTVTPAAQQATLTTLQTPDAPA